MIQLQTTQAGLAAITSNRVINFTRFVAGSGQDEHNAQLQTPEQEISIARSTTYLSGQTYTINGIEQVVDYNSVKLVGILDASLASEPYQWNELALMARLGSDVAETVIAYGKAVQGAYAVDPSTLNTYIINFELIFSDTPRITVDTTQTGVTWCDFLRHENANISSGIHGLRYADGTLYVNGQPMPVAQVGELLAITGIDSVVSTWPEPNLAWIGKVVLNRVNMSLKRLVKSEILHEGQFIYPDDNAWMLGNGTEAESLLVVSDEVSPSAGEITLSDAQRHFLAWQDVDTLDKRLQNLEEATLDGALSFGQSDNTVYNCEWVPRMTGSGTEVSPYVIYTPYDFNQIRNAPSAVYVLANDIDMSAAIGMNFRMEGGTLVRGDVDETAPLYNSGQGFGEIETFSGVLDGNGKVIRGLTCCGDVRGFIKLLDNARVQNLTLRDGFIVCTNAWWNENCTGSIAGYTSGSVYIHNCCNYNTVISTCTLSDKERHVGGILGCAEMIENHYHVSIKNCANHGALYNFSNHPAGSVCGIVGNIRNSYHSDVSCALKCCYNAANVSCKNTVGIAAKWASDYQSDLICSMSSCYNSGVLQGDNCWSITNDRVADNSDSIVNCWARNDYGVSVSPVHAIDIDDMRGEAFLEALNTGLVDTAYVADSTNVNSGLPILLSERSVVTGVQGALPIALLDADKGKIYSSKLSFDTLRDVASKAELRRLKEQLEDDYTTKSELNALDDNIATTYATRGALQIIQQSVPIVLQATLAVGDWVQESGLIYQDISQVGVSSTSTVILIPQSAACFDAGLSAGLSSSDTIRVLASSVPLADISVGVIVAG